MRFIISIIAILLITFNSALAVDLGNIKMQPELNDLYSVPNTKNGSSSYGGSMRPAMNEVCASKGLLPPQTCNNNCRCQCMCDQSQTSCQWLQYCK